MSKILSFTVILLIVWTAVPVAAMSVSAALPAAMIAVPLASVVTRRPAAWWVLVAGVAAIGVAVFGAPGVGPGAGGAVLHVLAGAGAGCVLPAALALAAEHDRRRLLTCVWAGALVGSLIMAGHVAAVRPWLTCAALAATGLYGMLRQPPPLAPARLGERTQLLLSVAPVTACGFLLLVTTGPGARLLVAVACLLGVVGLAASGSRDVVVGSPAGVALVMVGVGLLTSPVSNSLVEAGGPAAAALPFAAAGLGAVAGALARSTRAVLTIGYGLAVGAVYCATMMSTHPGVLVVLAAGLGLAAGAAIRGVTIGAALFGLSLCLPAVLAGRVAVSALLSLDPRAAMPPLLWPAVLDVVALLVALLNLRRAGAR
jgi:hypothetical protein